jgi:hypothetical protein
MFMFQLGRTLFKLFSRVDERTQPHRIIHKLSRFLRSTFADQKRCENIVNCKVIHVLVFFRKKNIYLFDYSDISYMFQSYLHKLSWLSCETLVSIARHKHPKKNPISQLTIEFDRNIVMYVVVTKREY